MAGNQKFVLFFSIKCRKKVHHKNSKKVSLFWWELHRKLLMQIPKLFWQRKRNTLYKKYSLIVSVNTKEKEIYQEKKWESHITALKSNECFPLCIQPALPFLPRSPPPKAPPPHFEAEMKALCCGCRPQSSRGTAEVCFSLRRCIFLPRKRGKNQLETIHRLLLESILYVSKVQTWS